MRKKSVFYFIFALNLLPFFVMSQVHLNNGLIAYYPFNGNANDATGNGNNGIPMNGVQLTTDRFGNPNSAYLFDGIDDYILVNDMGKLSPASATVAAFVNTESTLGQSITGKIDYTTGYAASYNLGTNYDVQTGFFFGVVPNNGTCFQQYPYDPNDPYAISGGVFSTNVWHCVVGTFNQSVLKIYVDGVLVDTKSSTTPDLLQCTNTQLLIGSWWAGDPLHFKGKIDDVRIYNRALNQEEVSALCSLQSCTALQGSLTGSNICFGDKGLLTFHSPNTTGPFVLTYTDGVNNYTQTNVLDGVPFTTQVNPTTNSSYTLSSILDTTNCPATLTAGSPAMIYVETPSVAAFPDTTVCQRMPVQLHASGTATYAWSPNSALSDSSLANPVASPLVSTTYTVTGTTAGGCVAKNTVTVATFPSLALIHTPDTIVCLGDPIQLVTSAGAPYTWSPAQYLNDPGIANPVARPLKTTRFILMAIDANHCTETDSVTLSIRPVPIFQAPPGNLSLCKGSSVLLDKKDPGKYVYSWSPGNSLDDPSSPNPAASPVSTTLYTMRVSDSVCINYDSTFSVSVNVEPSPVVLVQKANDIDCSIATSRLNASGATSYDWSPVQGLSDPHASNPAVSIDSTTTFIVRGTDRNGCFAFDTVTVNVTATGRNLFVVPNAFSPNGDGRNDCFGIRRWGDVTIEEFSVYDRWGMRIFTTRNPSECWDGNFRGKPQEAGAYPYVIKARSFCGQITRTGVVILIR